MSCDRTGDSISNVTREHLALASAMKLRLVVVITKMDLVPNEPDIAHTVESCCSVLCACGLKGSVVRSSEELWSLLQQQEESVDDSRRTGTCAPVFLVSSVTGQGLSLLSQFLFRVKIPEARDVVLQVNTAITRGCGHDVEDGEDAVILLLDHFRIDMPGGSQAAVPGYSEEGDDSLSPTAALKRLGEQCPASSVRTAAADKRSVLVLFGSVQSGNVCVGDKVLCFFVAFIIFSPSDN